MHKQVLISKRLTKPEWNLSTSIHTLVDAMHDSLKFYLIAQSSISYVARTQTRRHKLNTTRHADTQILQGTLKIAV